MFGKHFLTRLCWILCAIGLCLGWLNLSSCAVSPEKQASSTATSAQQGGPPTTPFLRIETGMHTAPIIRIDVDTAERYLVTASIDKTTRVWDLANGKLLQILRPPLGSGHEGRLNAVAISPDGRTVAVGGWTGYEWDREHSIYLFDRNSGQLTRRIAGLPDVIAQLAYSPDGRYLAAALLDKGIRVYRTSDLVEVGQDTDYGDRSNWVEFDRRGRLVSTSYDGYLRLYGADFKLIAKRAAPGGKRPYAARFSPSGDQVAVGFADSTAVNVLSGEDLSFRYAPATQGVDNGDVSTVAWSRDGQRLYAGGRYRQPSIHPILTWTQAGRGAATTWPASTDTLMDFRALANGRLAFGAQDSIIGLFDAQGRRVWAQSPTVPDHRGNREQFRVSRDGSVVQFSFKVQTTLGQWNRRPVRLNVTQREFTLPVAEAEADKAPLSPPITTAPGLEITGWEDTTEPRLNGQALPLEPYEMARSLAIAPDNQHFLLGTEWWLRLFDRQGRQQWEVPVPDVAFAVNISGDGQLAVAAFGDGSIRWYRLADGKERLAFFPHADGKRWVLWTPEGFFDTEGGQELIGYHLNQGPDRAGEFIKVEQLYAQFYRPDLVAQSLQADGERAIQAEVARIGDVHQVLASGLPPAIELLTPADVRQDRSDFALKFQVQNKGGGIGRVVYRIDGAVQEGRPGGTGIPGQEPLVTRLALPPGKHTVTVTAFNAKNEIESTPASVTVQVDTPKVQAALYVLSVGVDSYKDQSMNLKYAAADAREMAQEMQQRGQGLFRAVYVEPPLLNEAATLENINKAFAKLVNQVTENDVFVWYLAGHGVALDGEYYFFPYDLIYKNRTALREHGLTNDQLREMLAKMRATKTVLILDTCDAGMVISAKSSLLIAGRAPLAAKTAIDRLMQTTGRVILASATDRQMALEGYGGHGAFTYALLEGLHGKAASSSDKTILISTLSAFLDQEVPRITNSRQYPMMELQGMSFPIGLAP
jgi:WD40 repeat protein/uncharacterized caspase-like protein